MFYSFFISLLLLAGCSSVRPPKQSQTQSYTPPFFYRWYIVDNDAKMYRGKDESQDLPFSFCDDKSACVMLPLDEFYRLREDYEKSLIEINDLQGQSL
jgi:uncharacterized protein YceK